MSQWVRWVLAGVWIGAVVAPLWAVSSVSVVIAVIVVIALMTGALGSPFGLVIGLAGFVAAYPVALLGHELGHVFAARFVGWPVQSITVGPVSCERRGVRWTVRWNWRAHWMWGEVCISAGQFDRWRTALFAVGGPAANLLGLAVALLFVGPRWPDAVRGVAAVLAAHSLFLLAATLVPAREKGLDTDGLVLLKLITKPTWRGPPNGTTRWPV